MTEPMKYASWTEAEDNYIKENYKKVNDIDLSLALGRSVPAIGFRRALLGCLRKPSWVRWTDEEDALIRQGLSDREVANLTNRSVMSVCHRRARTLNISRKKEPVDYTDDLSTELTTLRKLGLTYQAIAEKLGLTKGAAIGRAHRMKKRGIDI